MFVPKLLLNLLSKKERNISYVELNIYFPVLKCETYVTDEHVFSYLPDTYMIYVDTHTVHT